MCGGCAGDVRRMQPMTSRLLMDAVRSQGQGPRAPRPGGYQQDRDDRVGPPPAGSGLRSDAIMEETKKHALYRQQQELLERKAQVSCCERESRRDGEAERFRDGDRKRPSRHVAYLTSDARGIA